jgi:tetratricopeptide (TPR) repeat protein
LNQAGLLAVDEHHVKQAEEDFAETARIAEQADLPRMSAEALLHLSQLYRQQGRFSDAGRAIDRGILQQKRVQEGYDLPLYLAEKAELEAALGHLRSADSLYDQATDLIEAMLIDAPTSRVKGEMIATMDQVYLGHFRLAVNRFHNPAKAFGVVESARGRALVDAIR